MACKGGHVTAGLADLGKQLKGMAFMELGLNKDCPQGYPAVGNPGQADRPVYQADFTLRL